MSDYVKSLNAHYGPINVASRILEHLAAAGKNIDALRRDDLTAFDEFHGGGRASTRALAQFAGLRRNASVLDVGSGIGGPARTLAAEYGCRVTGIDLTEEFCRAAEMLTARLGMCDAVSFHHGNAVDMPFPDESFDVVWSQNTLMNIEHKGELFSQIERVLKPGGFFAFEAVLAGRTGELHFPVFWAVSPELNYLVTVEQMQALLSEAGLVKVAWEDTTKQIIQAGRKRLAMLEREGPPPLGLDVIVPRDATLKMRNSLKNTEEGRTVAVQAVYARRN